MVTASRMLWEMAFGLSWVLGCYLKLLEMSTAFLSAACCEGGTRLKSGETRREVPVLVWSLVDLGMRVWCACGVCVEILRVLPGFP